MCSSLLNGTMAQSSGSVSWSSCPKCFLSFHSILPDTEEASENWWKAVLHSTGAEKLFPRWRQSCWAICAAVKGLYMEKRSEPFHMFGGYLFYWLEYIFITYTILKSAVHQLESVLPWGGLFYSLDILRSIVKEAHSLGYHWWCAKPISSLRFSICWASAVLGDNYFLMHTLTNLKTAFRAELHIY